MSIAESQLEVWSYQGDTQTRAQVHASVRNALGTGRLRDRKVQIYLQGSYGNDTNVRGSSDIDIVAQLTETEFGNPAGLRGTELIEFNRQRRPPDYPMQQYRQEVEATLRDVYGWSAVDSRTKCIEVSPRAGLALTVDVIPCCTYKQYSAFPERPGTTLEGVAIITSGGDTIFNFPRQHSANGIAKHQRTAGQFKPTVRMLKNARRTLVDRSQIADGSVSSYFLECFVYNMPDRHFTRSHQATYLSFIAWARQADLSTLVCQNELGPLFGPTAQQWEMSKATGFVDALDRLWQRGV